MEYIENYELREWVKKSLRKTIFLKAHELATQTGCEVLLKICDKTNNTGGNFYYASDSLQEEYDDKGVCKQPNEMCVSGETGLPVYPRVTTATQCVQSGEHIAEDSDSGVQNAATNKATSQEPTIPLHLTVTNDSFQLQDSLQHVDQTDEPVVKIEVIEEPDNDNDGSMAMSSIMSVDDETISSMQTSEGLTSFEMHGSSLQTFPIAISPKMYQCAVCQKAFRSVQVLQKHTQTFHMKAQMTVMSRSKSRGPGTKYGSYSYGKQPQKRYTCTLCSRSFPLIALYNDHMHRSHMMASSTQYQQGTTEQSKFDPTTEQSQFIPTTEQSQFDTSQEQSQFDATSEELQFDRTDEDNTDSGETSQMPRISQVMSLQPPIVQSSPVATSGSHVPFGVTITPTAVFHSPGPSTSSPAGSSRGPQRSTPSSRGKELKPRGTRLRIHSTTGIRTIMTAILLTAGPVTSFGTVVKNRRSMRHLPKEQYLAGLRQLQVLGFGYTTTIGLGKMLQVFIKAHPSTIHENVRRNADLCTLMEYRHRFNLPSPSYITKKMQDYLVQQGHVPRSYFK